jgi:hypothetical protein
VSASLSDAMVGAARNWSMPTGRPSWTRSRRSSVIDWREVPPASKKSTVSPTGCPSTARNSRATTAATSSPGTSSGSPVSTAAAAAAAAVIAGRHSGLRSAATLRTGRPLSASRAARSDGLPLCVIGTSSTARTSEGTCAADPWVRSVVRIRRASASSSSAPGRSTTSSTSREAPAAAGSDCSTAMAPATSGTCRRIV